MNKLLLSLFPGVDIFGKGFEKHGFTVVQAQDKILSGDIRTFRGIENRFDGIIGGSPCQDFSLLRRTPPTGEGLELLGHFERIVLECQPKFFLYENVTTVPDLKIEGYIIFRFSLKPTDLGYDQSRNRHFQFGSKEGLILTLNKKPYVGEKQKIATASEGTSTKRRTFADFCKLQGVPELNLPYLTQTARYMVVGNAVHYAVASELARAIKQALLSEDPETVFNTRTCACGCGMKINNRQNSYSAACRKRIQLYGVNQLHYSSRVLSQ